LEYCAKLNLPNLTHPACPSDVCDVTVQTKEGWCHFYSTYGCNTDETGEGSREIGGDAADDVGITNVLWRMVRTCDTPSTFQCPTNSNSDKALGLDTALDLTGDNVFAPEGSVHQCCKCDKERDGSTKKWYHLTTDGCLQDHPGNCSFTEVYDLADTDDCVPKTCARFTDTNAAETQPFDCTAGGTISNMHYNASLTGETVNPQFHTCCQCNNVPKADGTLDFYGPSPYGCTALVTCAENEYEVSAPDLTNNRICAPISDCYEGWVEETPPNVTTDRTCVVNQFYVKTDDKVCQKVVGGKYRSDRW